MIAGEGCDPREILAVEALRSGARVRLQVRGESMLPTLWPGDAVEIEASDIPHVTCGEIVLVGRDQRLFLHRVLTVNNDGRIVTRGDSMPRPDPIGQQYLGKLVRVFRGGQIRSPGALTLWSRAIGQLLCHCDWARRLALKMHQRRNLATGKLAVPNAV